MYLFMYYFVLIISFIHVFIRSSIHILFFIAFIYLFAFIYFVFSSFVRYRWFRSLFSVCVYV